MRKFLCLTGFFLLALIGNGQTNLYGQTPKTSNSTIIKAAGIEIDQPTISASPSATVCSGVPVTLTANVTNCLLCTYSWSNGATGQSITVLNGGTYSVTVSNPTGTATASQVVTVNPMPVVTLNINPASACLGSPITLTATGANSYFWNGPGISTTIGSNITALPTTSGIQQYSVTGTSNGCSETRAATVNVNTNPVLTLTPNDTTICAGSTVTLTASGAATYAWTPATGLNATTGASVVATPSATTTYTVTGSTNGCSSIMNRTINILPSVTCITTALPLVGEAESFSVSPNPSNGYLVVKVKLARMKRVAFKVVDVNGKLVYKSHPENLSGVVTRYIDLRTIAQGMYYLQTIIGAKSFVKKIALVL
jgi:hypothetical protein